jgi:acid phosphatase type 7
MAALRRALPPLAAATLAATALATAGCGAGTDAGGPVSGGTKFAPSSAERQAIVWAVGDGANGSAAGRAVEHEIAAGRVDRLLYLGDVYESGTRSQFAHNYATTYGPLAARTAPTPGNHDWPNHATGYDPYWRRALHRRTPGWYAFRLAGWQVISLNSEAPHGRGSPQERWLRARLRGAGTCRIALWHRPRFSDGTHHGDQSDMAPLWDDLRGHATIALAGHEHDMQRFKPIDGVTEFVSGAGGDGHYSLRRTGRLAFGNDRDYGALRLALRPGAASYAFVTTSGRVLDSGTVPCRR